MLNKPRAISLNREVFEIMERRDPEADGDSKREADPLPAWRSAGAARFSGFGTRRSWLTACLRCGGLRHQLVAQRIALACRTSPVSITTVAIAPMPPAYTRLREYAYTKKAVTAEMTARTFFTTSTQNS